MAERDLTPTETEVMLILEELTGGRLSRMQLRRLAQRLVAVLGR